jgi:hypothetical protein
LLWPNLALSFFVDFEIQEGTRIIITYDFLSSYKGIFLLKKALNKKFGHEPKTPI